MTEATRFRTILPFVQCLLAALFGSIGLWQRTAVLSRPFFEGQTLWDSTARFHVWPWPLKFAVVSNMPAFLVGSLLSWPFGRMWPKLGESVEMVTSLPLVVILWYWIGSRLDRRWHTTDKAPWIAILSFTLICLAGAFLPIGYVGYIPYGVMAWLAATLSISWSTPLAQG